MARYAHEDKLAAFSHGEYEIMLGTQMVAKGLDFPRVTLVGVISADQQLYNDDYRSLERAFALLTQVVGRSGRGAIKGRAVIQTLTPENPVIRLAAKQDYDAFYQTEILLRKSDGLSAVLRFALYRVCRGKGGAGSGGLKCFWN